MVHVVYLRICNRGESALAENPYLSGNARSKADCIDSVDIDLADASLAETSVPKTENWPTPTRCLNVWTCADTLRTYSYKIGSKNEG